jgi:hypothetical protein
MHMFDDSQDNLQNAIAIDGANSRVAQSDLTIPIQNGASINRN